MDAATVVVYAYPQVMEHKNGFMKCGVKVVAVDKTAAATTLLVVVVVVSTGLLGSLVIPVLHLLYVCVLACVGAAVIAVPAGILDNFLVFARETTLGGQ
jgi:hypothetical protein